jgi:glucokinase
VAKGAKCAGSYAVAQFIDVHGRIADDVTVVFRAAGGAWTAAGRGNVCVDGEIPARIWFSSCAVN